ncbi:MAG: hypothetical protein E7512_01055 [[Clostridium] sporosphaeroides]|uniref:Uncharacterized protein n=2 Tax=Faecalispora sporosphaeroides TaxID=1549 RepID=A0A928Q1S1_9FIRM|nr:hypothetical protein [Faecalispora sporosphaeroides]
MLGRTNMKKQKSSKSLQTFGSGKMSEQEHREKGIEAEEKNFCAIYNSFLSCISFPLYLYGCPMLPQACSFDHKQKKEEADKLSQKKNE